MPPLLSVGDVLQSLKRHALLESSQLEQLHQLAAREGCTPQTLGKHILEQGWLTPFQVNRILQGKVDELLLGPYQLQLKLGEGGMGQVFKARDPIMHRIVALKLIRAEILDGEQAIERFLREIRAAAGLDHPNIARAYHADRIGGTYYFVMEFVEGNDLHHHVKQGHPLSIGSVCDWVRQAAQALQHLAERGMVHRDVKPSNLLLSKQGVVKLVDLGLVRPRPVNTAGQTVLATRHGAMMGTPDYVAPEQVVDAASVDIRADIYSLGCTLYHLLAGRPPFPGDDLTAKIRGQLTEEPPLLEQLRSEVPPALASIVRRMLRKEPDQRYQSPQEVVAALAPLASHSGPARGENTATQAIPPSLPPDSSQLPSVGNSLTQPEKPEQKPGRRRWLPVAIVLPILLALGLVYLFSGPSGEPRPKDDTDPPPGGGPLAHNGQPPFQKDGPTRNGQTPKDGTGNEKPPPAIPVVIPPREMPPWKDRLPWQPAELVGVLGDERGRHWGPVDRLAWSGDGKRLASGGHDGLRVWDAETLRELCWLRESRPWCFTLSQDGRTLLIDDGNHGLEFWDLSGTQPKSIRKVQPPKEMGKGSTLLHVFLQDQGKVVLAADVWARVMRWRLHRDSEDFEELVPPRKPPLGPFSLASSGQRVAWSVSRLDDALFFFRDVGPSPGPEKEAGHELGRQQSLTLSPDGRWLVVLSGEELKNARRRGSQGGSIRVWDLNSDKPSRGAEHSVKTGGLGLLSFNADGSRLAFASGRNLYVRDFQDGSLGKEWTLRGIAGVPGALALSPSGKAIAVGGDDGAVRIFAVEARNEDPLETLTRNLPPRHLAFSADGNWLAAVHTSLDSPQPDADEHSLIRLWDLRDRKTPRELEVPGFLTSVCFLPDSQHLAVTGSSYTPTRGGAPGKTSGHVSVYDLTLQKAMRRLDFPDAVHRVEYHPLTRSLSVVRRFAYSMFGAHFLVRRYDIESWKELGEIKLTSSFLALDPSGKIGFTRPEGKGVFWDLSDPDAGAKEGASVTIGGGTGGFHTLFQEFFPDGKRIATINGSGRIDIWDVASRERLGSSDVVRSSAGMMALAPSGRMLAVIQNGNQVVLRHVSSEGKLGGTGKEPWKFPRQVNALAFDRSSSVLAIGNSNGTIYLLNLAGRQGQ